MAVVGLALLVRDRRRVQVRRRINAREAALRGW